MKLITACVLTLVSLSAVPAAAAELKVHDYWVAAAPAVAKSQAAYLCFINDSDKDVKITGVSAKGFGRAALHQSMLHGDMVMMHSIETLTVPAHKMVTLAPGGMHIMLMDPAKIAVAGEKVTLTVEYDDKTKQTFELEVKVALDKPSGDKDHSAHGKADTQAAP